MIARGSRGSALPPTTVPVSVRTAGRYRRTPGHPDKGSDCCTHFWRLSIFERRS